MRILIGNDDGVHAPGIVALTKAVAPLGEVVVAAPDRQRSASSHGISLHRRLFPTEVDYGLANVKAYSINGTPVDCIKWAISELSGSHGFDVMISGINEGSNLAQDVLYSGTVAAAGEAALQHVPSMATSLDGPVFHYDEAAQIVKGLLSAVPWSELGSDNFLNVNIPQIPNPDKYKVTKLGARSYQDKFVRRVDENEDVYYIYAGEPTEGSGDPDADTTAVDSGYTSITPLRYRFTNEALMSNLKTWIMK